MKGGEEEEKNEVGARGGTEKLPASQCERPVQMNDDDSGTLLLEG